MLIFVKLKMCSSIDMSFKLFYKGQITDFPGTSSNSFRAMIARIVAILCSYVEKPVDMGIKDSRIFVRLPQL